MRSVVFFFLLFLSCWHSALGEPNWTSFRGDSGQGITDETELPLEWSETKNIAWKTAVPGKGWSSPVIWDGKIWMTTAWETIPTQDEEEQLLRDEPQASQRQVAKSVSLRAICVDQDTGRLLSDIELYVVDDPDPIHLLNSYASPTRS